MLSCNLLLWKIISVVLEMEEDMHYLFNFNLNDFYRNKDGKKIIVLGVSLIAVGIYCSTRRHMFIKIFSWGISLVFFYGAWLSLKELNQLTKYASRTEIKKQRLHLLGFLLMAILLIVFPKWINIVISMVLGVLIVSRQVSKCLNYRKYKIVHYGAMDMIIFLVGLMMIVSPLFLSRFIVGILSGIGILFGIYFLSVGIKIENGRL